VKRLDLIRALEEAGCTLLRHVSRHDIYHIRRLDGRSPSRATGRSTRSSPEGSSVASPEPVRSSMANHCVLRSPVGPGFQNQPWPRRRRRRRWA